MRIFFLLMWLDEQGASGEAIQKAPATKRRIYPSINITQKEG
jgi:hypothetical protein